LGWGGLGWVRKFNFLYKTYSYLGGCGYKPVKLIPPTPNSHPHPRPTFSQPDPTHPQPKK
jgi:hypothetical protein